MTIGARKTRIAAVIASMFSALASHAGLKNDALATEVDSVDALPEFQRGWYVEDPATKKFKLDPAKVEIEDTSGLRTALRAARGDADRAERERKALAQKYDGIDPDAVNNLLQQLGDKEEQELLKQGKFTEVINKRTAKMQEAHAKELQKRDEAVKAEQLRTQKYQKRVLESHILAAATKAGIHAHAIDDALLRGTTQFLLDEDGNAVRYVDDEHKTVQVGKDGKTPYSVAEWFEEMKEKAPHWYPNGNSGGGSQGEGKGHQTGKKQMKRVDFNSKPPGEQSKIAREYEIVD